MSRTWPRTLGLPVPPGPGRLRRPGAGRERGQAGVELLGALPAMLVLALLLFQALAVGYSSVLAGNAAEAGAISLAGGGDAEEAARRALPGWSEAAMRVAVNGGRVEVSLRPPSPIEPLRERLRVTSAAAVRSPR